VLAQDDERLYGGSADSILSLRKSDGAPETIVTVDEIAAVRGGLAVDGQYIYFLAPCSSPRSVPIRRAPKGGGPAEVVVNDPCPYGIAVDETHLYWLSGGIAENMEPTRIRRMRIAP
jgi:hypothetical protein